MPGSVVTAIHDLHLLDAIGFLAGALTVSTFAQTAAVPMRVTAIAANLCFLTYAGSGGFLPILTLHAILLPINIIRLVQAARVSNRVKSYFGARHATLVHGLGGRTLRAAVLFASGLALGAILVLSAALILQPWQRVLPRSIVAFVGSPLIGLVLDKFRP